MKGADVDAGVSVCETNKCSLIGFKVFKYMEKASMSGQVQLLKRQTSPPVSHLINICCNSLITVRMIGPTNSGYRILQFTFSNYCNCKPFKTNKCMESKQSMVCCYPRLYDLYNQ